MIATAFLQIPFAFPDATLNIKENEPRAVQWMLAGTFADEVGQIDLWLLAGDTSNFPLRFTGEAVGELPPADLDARLFRDFEKMRKAAAELEPAIIDYEVLLPLFTFS
jgi:hypothetical protein